MLKEILEKVENCDRNDKYSKKYYYDGIIYDFQPYHLEKEEYKTFVTLSTYLDEHKHDLNYILNSSNITILLDCFPNGIPCTNPSICEYLEPVLNNVKQGVDKDVAILEYSFSYFIFRLSFISCVCSMSKLAEYIETLLDDIRYCINKKDSEECQKYMKELKDILIALKEHDII